MTGGYLPGAALCLAVGAALGCLFLLCKVLRLSLGLGKWATALLDVLFCLVCGAVAFLCALVLDQGRLRLLQVVCHGVGAWAAVTAWDPLALRAARGLKKISCKVGALFRGGAAFALGLFPKGEGSGGKNRKKTGEKPKKAKKRA